VLRPTYLACMALALLGIDVGSSSVKVSLLDADRGITLASAQSPDGEMPIAAPHPGWAEQDPDDWWRHVQIAIRQVLQQMSGVEVQAIGIAYQMHGLVLLDKHGSVLRPSIIWCDSRAVDTGDQAFRELGENFCLTHFLNSPGNFTAAKLKWVKDNEPAVYERIHTMLLPGDYIAYRLTGERCTTPSGLSEGVLWDFQEQSPAYSLMRHWDFPQAIVPDVRDTFSIQGQLLPEIAQSLGLPVGIPVSYRAGDQPNNAWALGVTQPSEVAATAGTSAVVYAVAGQQAVDEKMRVNTFLHVSHSPTAHRLGVLLCINGSGILYNWIRNELLGSRLTYTELNSAAELSPIGSSGLRFFPFGNGAERVLGNQFLGASVQQLDFNRHGLPTFVRAAQEGIAFAMAYGTEVLTQLGLDMNLVRAGQGNLFQSAVFRQAFVNTLQTQLELFATDGAAGAARGAGVGVGYYRSIQDAFYNLKPVSREEPTTELAGQYRDAYQDWKVKLEQMLKHG
jgi:xylulokinase